MTRTERLAEAARRAKARMAEQKVELARVQAALRAEDRKRVTRRRMQVGMLADQAGLLTLEDVILAALFALLTPLTHLPDPVAVLDALLTDIEAPAGLKER